ncbi:MAG: hypothetical protein IJ733_03930 [Lachnospiraceae bacterium]|nr:hypothetical protein [Lachnospiraceae bacterium]
MMRKKWYSMAVVLCLSISLFGCGNQNMVNDLAGKGDSQKTVKSGEAVSKGSDTSAESEEAAEVLEEAASADMVDLTTLNSTMVYSEVYNIMAKPEDYIGKRIKMKGNFSVFEGDKQRYFSCIIQDATACCAQGLEFELKGEHEYPKDYPEENEEITVTGTFDTYDEDGYTYCVIRNAELQS